MNSFSDHRRFLAGIAVAAACASMPSMQRGQKAGTTLALDGSAASMPSAETFTGVSYESSQPSHPGYFSAGNHELVTLFRSLGTAGILRIGGNTREYDDWVPEKTARTDPGWAGAAGPDTGRDINHHTRVTQSAIDELRTFLDATGWKLIYGIDLGHGSPESAADEAAYVVRIIGPALVALQIGNEADLFYRNTSREPDYAYADYFAECQLALTAPAVTSKTGVELGGKSVSAQEPFTAAWSAPWAWQRDEVIVPKTSALLLEFA